MSEAILKSHQYLDEQNIPYRRLSFSPDTEKGAANVAHALGFKESQMVKSLIFEVGGTNEHIMILVPADKNAISSNLKKAIRSRDIRMATPAGVILTTGYAIGSIPPFSWQQKGFRTFIDEEFMVEEEIIIKPEDLVKAANAKIVNLTRPQ
jgi:Cys-tRNA(Pro)/Cys-tRNA(Cys) deacylase